jgi:hypothetical protein
MFQVGGITALSQSIRKIGDKELGKEMKAASKAAAETIVPFAKRRAPVGVGTKRPGALRDSIKADATRSIARIKAGSAKRVPYARAIHSGKYVSNRTRSYRTKGNPFLREAIPEAWPQLVRAYEDGMNRIAEKFFKKHGVHRVLGRYKK